MTSFDRTEAIRRVTHVLERHEATRKPEGNRWSCSCGDSSSRGRGYREVEDHIAARVIDVLDGFHWEPPVIAWRPL